jgi:hypothetical protein
MTLKFIETIEKTIASNPIILSSNIQKHFGPDSKTVYVRGSIIFIDSSVLEIAIFAAEISTTVIIDKYRFHYMDNKGEMIFRYDNAPHHPEIPSYPHHKHIKNLVIPAHLPNLKEILNEISAMILKK